MWGDLCEILQSNSLRKDKLILLNQYPHTLSPESLRDAQALNVDVLPREALNHGDILISQPIERIDDWDWAGQGITKDTKKDFGGEAGFDGVVGSFGRAILGDVFDAGKEGGIAFNVVLLQEDLQALNFVGMAFALCENGIVLESRQSKFWVGAFHHADLAMSDNFKSWGWHTYMAMASKFGGELSHGGD